MHACSAVGVFNMDNIQQWRFFEIWAGWLAELSTGWLLTCLLDELSLFTGYEPVTVQLKFGMWGGNVGQHFYHKTTWFVKLSWSYMYMWNCIIVFPINNSLVLWSLCMLASWVAQRTTVCLDDIVYSSIEPFMDNQASRWKSCSSKFVKVECLKTLCCQLCWTYYSTISVIKVAS